MTISGAEIDFFISYAGRDRAWAEWVAWELELAGYNVELDTWDWNAGDNLVGCINAALMRSERVIAVLSTSYFEGERFTTLEWTTICPTDRLR